jgi:hypothetical protein
MQTFQELKIKNNDIQELKNILRSTIAQLPPDWKFLGDLAQHYSKNVSKHIDEIGCFESPEISKKIAKVWFVIWENELKIVNIVPSNTNTLTYDEYNQILMAFNKQCLPNSIAASKNTEVIITDPIYDIEVLAGASTYTMMYKWATSCNPSTGNTHSNDFERWADFLSMAYREKTALTANDLGRWLSEDMGWKEETVIADIMHDYDYGLSIIDHYAKHQ